MRSKFYTNNLTKDRINKKFLENLAKRTLRFVKIEIPEISLVLVCDARMKALNRRYCGRDRVTDVLSFGYGEIIICLPQAKRQAKKLGHSLRCELATLLIHGILHLSGQNDETKNGYNKMLKIQNNILAKLKTKTEK